MSGITVRARLRAGALLAAGLFATAAEAQSTIPPNDPAQAQAAEPPAPPVPDQGDVVVTARRTSERLQDVPVAVTAFGGPALAQRNIDTLDQIAKYTPNIRFDGAAALSGAAFNATVFIRGVGQNDFAIFTEPGVGFYVDDVYYARSIGGVLDAVDLDSVQVLRGPQGTLFGKNTIGGAVIISTAKPRLDLFEGKVEATTGSFARKDFKAALNVPLGDIAALRISAATLHRDGFTKRLADDSDEGNRNANIGRVRLLVKPDSRLTIDLGADYTWAREHSAPSALLAVANVPGINGIPYLTAFNNLVAPGLGIIAPNGGRTLNTSYITQSPYETYATGPNRNDLDLWGVQGTVSYDLGGATLKSVTAYRHLKAYFARDGDNTPFTFRQTRNDDTQRQFSEELNLSGKAFDDRFSYVGGLYYFRETGIDNSFADLAIGLDPPLPPPSSPASYANIRIRNTSLAAYAQASLMLLPGFTIEAGGRYSRDKKFFSTRVFRRRDNVLLIDAPREAVFSKFTPRLGLNYKPTTNVLLYGSYSQGFKQGGFNGRPLVSASEVTRYEPETLDTFEIGAKTELLDRKLTANVALFHSIYKNIQLTVNQTPQNFIANAAKGKIDGVELELVARPVSWFTANAGLGYLHTRYTSVGSGLGPTQILPITLASHFVKSPDWTATAGVEVRHRFDHGGTLTLRSDLSLYSRIYNDVANTPIITDDGYTLVNARLSYLLPGNRLEVAVFGTNLTKALYLVSGNASSGFGLAEASYGRPREWGLSASYKF